MVCFFETGGRVSPRRARYLFFATPKKSTQKKGDPQSATPSRCYGANLQRGVCGVRRGTRYALARCARTTTASQLTRHARSDAHAHPATAPPQAQPDGGGERTSQHPHGPLLRSAQSAQRAALAPGRCGPSAAMARVAVWLSGFWAAPPLLAAPTAGRLRGGMGAFARMLRHLTRRVCPNAAAQQRSELCGAPRKRPAAGLPRRGRRLQGRLSFGYFSLAKQRTSTSPAGARPGPRP